MFYLSIYLLVDTWVSTFGCCEQCCHIHWYMIVWFSVFNSWGYIPRSRIAGSYDNSIFSFLRTCPNVFHSGCSIPTRDLRRFQLIHILDNTYLLFFFFIIAILVWSNTVILICISLITLAWRIPWMEEPGGLQAMGSLRHDWVTSLSLFTFMHWRRKWQPAPVFLPGESQGRGSLMGCHLWGCAESDTTEAT